jgi:aspartate-semialdehyde dehydrogenase
MKVAVVGATGLVGNEILEVLSEREFPVTELIPVASKRSLGKAISFKGNDYEIVTLDRVVEKEPALALFSAGSEASIEWAPRFAEAGITVVDNSSAWRMKEGIPLVVPEVNANILSSSDKIIANPNCSTIQLVMVLKPLQDKYCLKRVVVSTYQSTSGTGKQAMDQMAAERLGKEPEAYAYPHSIDLNCLPHCDVFLDNAYTKEEMKLVNEPRKIMGLPDLRLTATAVRVPVVGGHSEAVNIEFENEFSIDDIMQIISRSPGLRLVDDPQKNIYPMPRVAHKKDDVMVGRIRRDESQKNSLNCWIVADNLRKGAATNAVQIAQYLLSKGWI